MKQGIRNTQICKAQACEAKAHALPGYAKAVGGCVLALMFSCALAAPPTAYAATVTADAVYEKDENVYATLDYDGALGELYVVNQFDVISAGIIRDVGSYDRIANLTDISHIISTDGVQEVEAGEGVFYYQGDIDEGSLPWIFDITYTLDGQEVSAEQLAGKEGRVGIHIASSVDENVNVQFAQTYLLQVTLTIPADVCRNIEAEGASIADAGSDRRITYTVMPGQNADISLYADVENFEMDAISIAGASAVSASSQGVEQQVSFVSSENDEEVNRVQFAPTTKAIEVPEAEEEVVEESEKSFFERVLALFGF